MIRVLLASALAFVGVGAAVTSLSPDLLAGPHGEPLVMVTPGDSGFQAASLDGGSCGTTFLLATPNDVGLPSFGWGVMAFTTSMNADNIAVVLGDLSDGPDTPRLSCSCSIVTGDWCRPTIALRSMSQ